MNAGDDALFDAYLLPNGSRNPRLPPAGTKAVRVNDIGVGCADYLTRLGRRFPRLTWLIVDSTVAKDVDFLVHFPNLQSLTLRCYTLADLSGLIHCRKLKVLRLRGSLSARPSVASIAGLTHLEGLEVEGPNPGKGFDQLLVLPKLKTIHLYRPKWDLALLARFAPQVEELSIYHHNATALEFLRPLRRLRRVSLAYFRKLKSAELFDEMKLAEVEITHCPHLADRHAKNSPAPLRKRR